jgi:hypothetical protein
MLVSGRLGFFRRLAAKDPSAQAINVHPALEFLTFADGNSMAFDARQPR